METKDDLKKFLERSKTTSTLIARESYEQALGLAISLIEMREAQITLLQENIEPRLAVVERILEIE